jgi:hypothetical protein
MDFAGGRNDEAVPGINPTINDGFLFAERIYQLGAQLLIGEVTLAPDVIFPGVQFIHRGVQPLIAVGHRGPLRVFPSSLPGERAGKAEMMVSERRRVSLGIDDLGREVSRW